MGDTLDATLTVTPTAEGLELALTVENVGTDAVDLSFSDGQRAEFVAVDAAGEERWRWSDGRAFTMAIGVESVAPGETATHAATWKSPSSGEYEVTGSLAATNADAEATTTVVVPDGG